MECLYFLDQVLEYVLRLKDGKTIGCVLVLNCNECKLPFKSFLFNDAIHQKFGAPGVNLKSSGNSAESWSSPHGYSSVRRLHAIFSCTDGRSVLSLIARITPVFLTSWKLTRTEANCLWTLFKKNNFNYRLGRVKWFYRGATDICRSQSVCWKLLEIPDSNFIVRMTF